MSLVTVEGFGVIRGSIALPRVGAWHAELDVDADTVLEGRVAIYIEDAGLELLGTVSTGQQVGGINRVRIVAGADGLRKTAAPKHYVRPTLRLPLEDLCKAAGETVSSTSAQAILSTLLLGWTTIGVGIGEQIAALVSRACPEGTAWRMLPDGTLWVGGETWTESEASNVVLLDENPRERRLELAVEGIVLPGTTLEGRRVDYVAHVIDDHGRHITHVWEAAP